MKRYVTISDPAEIEAVLKSDVNQVADSVKNFETLSKRMTPPLVLTERLVAMTPITHNGERHREIRQSARADLARPAVEKLEARFEAILIQARQKSQAGGSINLIAEVVDPLTDETLIESNQITPALPDSEMTKLSAVLKKDGGLTRFFDPGCPISIRRRNENILQTLDDVLSENGIEETARSRFLRSMVLMGRDPMRGYLSAHLITSWMSSQETDGPQTGCPYPGGVQWILRIKPAEQEKPDSDVWYRLMLSTSEHLAFGQGRHQCLGKAIALQAVKSLDMALEKCRLRVDITRFDASEPLSVFSTPKALEGKIVDDSRSGQEG